MKMSDKKKRWTVAFVILVAIVLIVYFNEPPVKQEAELDAQNYLKVNRYVSGLREELIGEGRIRAGFLPPQVDEEQVTEYLYWYSCAILGDPNYGISVTLKYSTDDALLSEINRIEGLGGFKETECRDHILIGGKELSGQLKELFGSPVRDGSRYVMEYAIVSIERRTITYSEVCIWENQILHATIESQLNLIYGILEDEV